MITAFQSEVTEYKNNHEYLLDGLQYIELYIRWAVERARQNDPNPEDGFRGLYISDEQVDILLGQGISETSWAVNGHKLNGQTVTSWTQHVTTVKEKWEFRTKVSRQAGLVLPLEHLIDAFDLTVAERDILLIALAPEIDLRFERLIAYLQDDVTRKRPSLDLILNLMCHTPKEKLAFRELLGENGRLVSNHLIQFGQTSRDHSGLANFITLPPHLIHFFLDDIYLDSQITGWAELIHPNAPIHSKRVPDELLDQLETRNQSSPRPLFALSGQTGMGKQEAAKRLASANSQPLLKINISHLLAEEISDAKQGFNLAMRDGRLFEATLFCEHWDTVVTQPALQEAFWQQLRSYPHTVILGSQRRWQPENSPRLRPIYALELPLPNYARRFHLWQQQLENMPNLAHEDVQALANHFRFTPAQIEFTAATAKDIADWEQRPLQAEDLFAASRLHSNQNLNNQATKIQPRYQWQDIILPPDTRQQLQEMVNMVQERPTVYGQWGFGQKQALGKGLNALFAGESGTGKTMAADIMAGTLGLDLYKIDLSSLVSKYIGETEKNLERIFTEASTSNAILFFDEADAIFGKRSEVKDSHDRYANIEISYLLQRMEMYDGVVILATNLRANLDDAFTRRLHFAIEFPFPEAADREHIWRVNIPPAMPLDPDVDFPLLAQRFRLAGGNIRNIILAAAFLAANADGVVKMTHFLHAARREYQKMGRLIDEKLFVN